MLFKTVGLLKAMMYMKLTIVFLLLSLQLSANVFSQNSITLKLQSADLKKALTQIEKKSSYKFLYNEDIMSSPQKVTIDANNEPVTNVLETIFSGTGLTYRILNNNLVVVTKKDIVVQDVRVSGKVTDANGSAVPNTSVNVKGSKSGTTTGADGSYSITVPEGATLVFSSVGYETQEVAVNGRSEINIVLRNSTKVLDQVVVVGYGSQRKIDVTGSVTQVKGEEISKQASLNAISSLQGKVAGLQITNAGSPGAPPQILIRGVGTLYGKTNPLFVVDGVWFEDISFLNSSDIENISVLKDASSGSIYGIRGANGVILITTKKGRPNAKAVVNYNAYIGTQIVTNQIEMVNGREYAELVNEVDALSGQAQRYSDPSSYGTTDWYHQMLRTAMVTNHQISVTGGAEKSSYNFSLGYYHQDGLVKTTGYDRYTFHFSNDMQIAPFLKAGINTTGSFSKSKDAPGGIFYEIFNAAPIVPVYYADGAYGDAGDYNIAASNQKNPQASLDFFNQHTKTFKINGNVYAEAKFLKHFTFRTSVGGDFQDGEIDNFSPFTNYLYVPVAYRKSRSELTKTQTKDRNWIVENLLTFEKKFNDHSVKALLGHGAQGYSYYKSVASSFDVPQLPGTQPYISLGQDTTVSFSDVDENDLPRLDRVLSYFGRVNYSFKDRYLLNASLRADGTSKFSDSWGYFPSVGIGWVITKENFMQNQKIFDNLKLRGSWGKIGNLSVPAKLSDLTISQTPNLVYVGGNGGASTGASINTVVPDKTKWELTEGTDIGIEASLLHNRLYAEIDWYNKKTSNAIFDIPVLGSVGTSTGTLIGNQATFQNQGFEFLLTWRDNINKDWNYSVSANAGFNKNKVLSVATGANPIYQFLGTSAVTRTVVGQPIGQFYGRQVVGIFQSADDIANYKSSGGTVIQPQAKPGDFKFKDMNDDGVIDDKDRTVLGNPNPKMVYGININVGYKKFDLTLDLQGLSGIEIYNGNYALRYGGENYTKDYYDNRWHGEGTSNVYPSVATSGNASITNSFYVEDGSYFRIRNVQLGYTFNGIKTVGISRLRVYVNAQNPCTWFHYRGFTPEVQAGSASKAGIDQQVYPLYATYNFGVNLTF